MGELFKRGKVQEVNHKNNASNGFVRMEFVDDSLSQKGDIVSALESLSVRELDLPNPLPKQLEHLIESIGRTGIIEYKWAWLSKLFRVKIHQVLHSYFDSKGFIGPIHQTFDTRYNDIIMLLDRFDTDAPFTTQRLAEVLCLPHINTQFVSTHKLINSIEKLLSVSSTIPCRSVCQESNSVAMVTDTIILETTETSAKINEDCTMNISEEDSSLQSMEFTSETISDANMPNDNDQSL